MATRRRARIEWGYQFLPKNVGDHSHMPMFIAMHEGVVKGFMAMGQNPAVGGQNAIYQRAGLAKLEWLVVRDLFLTETAEFWKAPDVADPSAIQTEVFFLPSSTVPEMEGSFTNTQRLVQWHEKGIEAPGDCRSDLWFTHHLCKRLKQLYAGLDQPQRRSVPRARPGTSRRKGHGEEPVAQSVLKEINGYTVADRVPVKTFTDLKDDGSTAAGRGSTPASTRRKGVNKAAARVADDWVSLGWAFAWPANRRILYNRASADPSGKPWSERKKYVWWDAGAAPMDRIRRAGLPGHQAAGRTRASGARAAWTRTDGDAPFIMKPDGKAWLFAPNGLVDGPLPTHYEPWEAPGRERALPRRIRRTRWPRRSTSWATGTSTRAIPDFPS